MLGVGHGVSDDVLQEGSHDHSDLVVNCGTDPFDTTTPSQSSNRRFGDAHDGISRNPTVHM